MIRPSTPDDLRCLPVTAMRAFVDDPVMRWLYPDDDYLTPGGEVFRGEMARWHAGNEVWCTDDCVALAVWIQPGRPTMDVVVDPPQAPPSPDLVERFTTLAGFMAEHTPTEEHWYLQLLATHPDWQRRGLGTTLMASMFERTDAEGLPCYLETETEVNVAYYRHHGFEVRSEWDVTEGPHMWGMLRPVH
ncbi:MAG: GNAT family N-acetyltransferase [Acidimicrobiia bacterium]|nr:GNAT family N-acetyltransferase [Acidimicrobiia bacterium]